MITETLRKALATTFVVVVGCASGPSSKAGLTADDAAGETGNTPAVGTKECPRSGTTCEGAQCSVITARRVDRTRNCLLPSEPVVCTKAVVWLGGYTCAARTTDGALFSVPKIMLREPEYVGWRPCTDAETLAIADCPE